MLDKASLISCSTFILFLSLVLICKRVENPLLHRYVVANGSNVQNARFDICGYDSDISHQNCDSDFSWQTSRAVESFLRSINCSCISSGMSLTFKEGRTGFVQEYLLLL